MSQNPSLKIDGVTVGADIELFLQHKYSKAIVSAEGIIKGTKDVPFKFMEGNEFFATSLDNVMAEFCIPPAKSATAFADNILYARGWIDGFIPAELQTFAAPAAHVGNYMLQTENAKLFGCDPDFNAWLLGQQNPKPCATGDVRTCGGHIHVGYANPKSDTNMLLVRAMDIFLGLPGVLQEPDNLRKTLYGKAGAFRHKTYGVEYRTISNYYADDRKLMEWAYENTLAAIDFVNKENSIGDAEADAIQDAINTGNKEAAQRLVSYFGVKLAA